MPVKDRWSEKDAAAVIAKYGDTWGEELALRTYSSRLIGAEPSLVLHGGGNTSVKGTVEDALGNAVPAIFVKASGHDLASIEPAGHTALSLDGLRPLRELSALSDAAMLNEVRTRRFDAEAATPSTEALMHAFIPFKFIDHTHADAILALTNQRDGERIVRDALGDDIIVVDYVRPGFDLARAAMQAFKSSPTSEGMVLMKHGLVTWGETARASYERTIDIVTRAEEYLAKKAKKRPRSDARLSLETAKANYRRVAPLIRGVLAVRTGDPDNPYDRFILRPVIDTDVLAILGAGDAKSILMTPPLTGDHLIRTKALPLWLDEPVYDDPARFKTQITDAVAAYAEQYRAYVERFAEHMPEGLAAFDAMPRVVLLPGLGAVCAGRDAAEARVAADIATQTIRVKAMAAAVGGYEGLDETHLFDMEYRIEQHAKVRGQDPPLRQHVALVTGAAGAIGAGICEGLLRAGCHVAVSDLPGERLDAFADELKRTHGERVVGVALDVTDRASVAAGFDRVVDAWGGIDLVVPNAGLAHVSSLADMDEESFHRLEKVNVRGTLNVLAEAARRFDVQGTGGDVVVISSKNVFAPGATFGAYSATKAAAHQLARIASVELAAKDVRVNMVSPDAVFAHGDRKSGLWEEVGPERMQSRGLDREGLEVYYRERNLLKARVTAEHVARAVLFFATRQTPTTGATLPVDGGLPDATPR